MRRGYDAGKDINLILWTSSNIMAGTVITVPVIYYIGSAMLEYKGSWLSVAIMIQYRRGIQMCYEFGFYKEEDFEEIEQLVLASYS